MTTAATLTVWKFDTPQGAEHASKTLHDLARENLIVIHDAAVDGYQGSRGSDHVTRYNTMYESGSLDFVGSTNVKYPNDTQSGNRDLCFHRKRWTESEEVCIPFGETVQSSPHATLPSACSTALGVTFGLPTVFYP